MPCHMADPVGEGLVKKEHGAGLNRGLFCCFCKNEQAGQVDRLGNGEFE